MPTPPRRWFQFSLRTMFAGMILASVVFGWWVHTSREWIKQRNEAKAQYTFSFWDDVSDTEARPRAPGGLWLFGERGFARLWCLDGNPDTVKAAQRLFPEAEVYANIPGY
jgi:hypothetical protein